MRKIAELLRPMSVPERFTVVGGLIGGIAGLVIGLRANVPTAPFAVVELGLPAAIVSGAVGLVVSLMVKTFKSK